MNVIITHFATSLLTSHTLLCKYIKVDTVKKCFTCCKRLFHWAQPIEPLYRHARCHGLRPHFYLQRKSGLGIYAYSPWTNYNWDNEIPYLPSKHIPPRKPLRCNHWLVYYRFTIWFQMLRVDTTPFQQIPSSLSNYHQKRWWFSHCIPCWRLYSFRQVQTSFSISSFFGSH